MHDPARVAGVGKVLPTIVAWVEHTMNTYKDGSPNVSSPKIPIQPSYSGSKSREGLSTVPHCYSIWVTPSSHPSTLLPPEQVGPSLTGEFVRKEIGRPQQRPSADRIRCVSEQCTSYTGRSIVTPGPGAGFNGMQIAQQLQSIPDMCKNESLS